MTARQRYVEILTQLREDEDTGAALLRMSYLCLSLMEHRHGVESHEHQLGDDHPGGRRGDAVPASGLDPVFRGGWFAASEPAAPASTA